MLSIAPGKSGDGVTLAMAIGAIGKALVLSVDELLPLPELLHAANTEMLHNPNIKYNLMMKNLKYRDYKMMRTQS